MIKGIDVSIWNGEIDWDRVKAAGVEFAIIRSSYGDGTSEFINSGSDQLFEKNYQEAGRVGIARGVYHYSYARNEEEARKEADFFLSKLRGKVFEYPVVLDIEDEKVQGHLRGQALTNIAKAFLEKVEKAGYYVMIYSSKNWLENYLNMDQLSRYDVWLAQWANQASYRGPYGIWQYTSTGTVNGIETNVDLNYSLGDYKTIIQNAGLNGFEKKNTEEKPKLVSYSKPKDRMAAEALAQKLACPVYYEAEGPMKNTKDFEIIKVGGEGADLAGYTWLDTLGKVFDFIREKK